MGRSSVGTRIVYNQIFTLAALLALLTLIACDTNITPTPQLAAASPTPAIAITSSPTMAASSPTTAATIALGPLNERKLLVITTPKGTMKAEIYPAAGRQEVEKFSVNYVARKGTHFSNGSQMLWFDQPYDYKTNSTPTPDAAAFTAYEANNLPYKRGSLMLPVNLKGQVNTGSFAILRHDVPPSDREYKVLREGLRAMPGFDVMIASGQSVEEQPYEEAYTVVGQLVEGFDVLDKVELGDEVSDIAMIDSPAAAATLAAVRPTIAPATDFVATHMMTMTNGAGQKMVAVLYGYDAPKAVASFITQYKGFKGGMFADNGDTVQCFTRTDVNQTILPAETNKLPIRRGSLLLGGGDGKADVTRLLISKYDGSTNGGNVVIGQVTQGIEMMDGVGLSAYSGGFAPGDHIADIEIEPIGTVATVTPSATPTAIPTLPPAARNVFFSFDVSDNQSVKAEMYFPAEVSPGYGDEDLYENLNESYTVDDNMVALGASDEFLVQIDVASNQLPFKRGSFLMKLAEHKYHAQGIVILKRDMPQGVPGYTVVGEVTQGMELVDKIKNGESAAALGYSANPAPTFTPTPVTP